MRTIYITADQFNEKYKDYLEEGHYGLAIDNPDVVKFLDEAFQDLIKIPGFRYSQIKIKFGTARFYCDGARNLSWLVEREITRIVNEEDKNK